MREAVECGSVRADTVSRHALRRDGTAFPDVHEKWIDRIWNTFSSVKIAIGIIIVILVASAVGTVFPQQQYIPVPVPTEADVARFYTDTYGTLGTVYYGLGFHNLYSSWWFVTLLVLLGTSLVICSLDRVVPLYKALSKPRLNQHKSFLKGQKLFGEGELAPDADQAELLERSAAVLKKKATGFSGQSGRSWPKKAASAAGAHTSTTSV